MPIYMISVTCAAALSGIILSVIFYRLKVLNFRTAAAITMASLVTALAMPGFLSLIYSSVNNPQDPSMPAILTVVSVLAYLVLVCILSAVISLLLPKVKLVHKPAALSETVTADAVDGTASLPSGIDLADIAEALSHKVTEPETQSYEANSSEKNGSETEFYEAEATEVALGSDHVLPEALTSAAEETAAVSGPVSEAAIPFTPEDKKESSTENIMDGDFNMKANVKPNISGTAGDNYIEDIFLKFVGRNDENPVEIASNEVNEGFEENTEEKSVDSNENIDKMGIENNIHDSNILTIEECIDEAFRLRAAGDPEGSILYYMYALDKKPQKELTFWIILDICVMYKSLGQHDLALDILDSYYDIYGNEMDSSIKEEIARNLTI